MNDLTLTKNELHQKYFAKSSRTTFSKLINSILPVDMKNKKTLYPKQIKIIKEELGIE